MDNPKVIIKKYLFEYEVGLSTYDLTLISMNKNKKKDSSLIKEETNTTYLI